MDDDAALDGGEAEPRDEELAGDDRATIQAGNDALADRARSASRARGACRRRGRAASPAERSCPAGARASRRPDRSPSPRRRRPSPSTRGSGSPRRRGDDDGTAAARATVSWSARPIVRENMSPRGACSPKCSSPTAARSPSAIFRTLRELGIGTVAVYSEADRGALHVAVADEAYLIGPGAAGRELPRHRAAARDRAARRRRGDPSRLRLPRRERGLRARRREAGLVWIGPPPEAIEAMGSKTAARERMQAAGVPIIPGTTEPVDSAEEVVAARRRARLPARDQGVGRRRREGAQGRARSADEVERAFESARREGEAYFADATVYVERYLEDPRHVEVQVLADAHGNVDPPRRARLHDPAPPPEARRGDAVARRRRRAARADRRDRRRRGARRRLPVGRNDRGPARPRTATTTSSR